MTNKPSLSARYTREFIAQADDRRGKLDYKPLHVGKSTTPRTDRVLKLLYETHQNYYFGHFNASCVLGGVLFEQCLICLLEEEIEIEGKITYKQGKDLIDIRDPEALINQPLWQLINIAGFYKIIPREHFQLANELRLIRNYLMHDSLGAFMEDGEEYRFLMITLVNGVQVSNQISIPVEEVRAHCLMSSPDELWAYYILTRTRHLIEHMFEERVKRLPPEKVGA